MLRRSLALVAVLTIVFTACSGSGDLQVIVDGEGSGFGDFAGGGDKTFGLFICADGGPVELESIEASGIEGDVELIGAVVYTSDSQFVGAVDGFPPVGIESKVEPMEGAVVEVSCVEPDGDERVQLLIGVERTGTGGGKLDGVVIGTSGGDVEVTYSILMCGDELEFCDVLENAEGG